MGEVPLVTILTGGIPAWEGFTLDELSLENTGNKDSFNYMKSGIAPVFHINGRNLKVNMSRREVIDDNNLQEILKKSRSALNELVQICSDHAYPRTRLRRAWYGIKKVYRSITSSYWKIILSVLILIIPVEIYILNRVLPAGTVNVATPNVVNVKGYRQYSAVVDKLGPGVVADIRYTPEENVWFKMFTAPQYNRVRGFIWDGSANYIRPSPLKDKTGDKLTISMTISNGGDVFLPHPSEYRIDEGSIKIRGSRRFRLKKSDSGEVILNVPGHNKALEYTCFSTDFEDPGYQNKYLSFPENIRFSDEIEARIKELFYQNIDNKISISIKITNILVDYDISEGTAGYYRALSGNRNWLKKVLEIGAGDCDVINGVLCLILRKSGVRSKLVVGLIGENGYVLPRLHSWVEYYDNGWKKADATASSTIQGGHSIPDEEFSFVDKSNKPVIDDENKTPELLFKMFLLLILLSVFPFFLFYREKLAKDRERKAKLNPSNKVKARRDIIEIGKSYLLAPELWNYNFDIVEQEIITTISGKNISIKKGIKLLKQRKLFSGRAGNVLVDELKKSDEVIVDSDNVIQHPLIRLFYGIIDLDGILNLSVDIQNKNGDELTIKFISEINRILKTLRWKKLLCLNGPGLKGPTFRDIDLSLISFKSFFRKTGYPSKFIVLNMSASELSGIRGLYVTHPELALYRFFKLITDKSLFFYNDRNISFRKILRSILKNG